MTSKPGNSSIASTSRELLLLLLASLACALVLTAGVVQGSESAFSNFGLSQVIVIGVTMAGALAAVVLVLRAAVTMRGQVHKAQSEAASLKRQLAVAEAVIGGEPQILVLWDTGLQPQIVCNTLRGVPGLPVENAHIVSFSNWLDAASAARVKEALAGLLRVGRPFNMILRTVAGVQL